MSNTREKKYIQTRNKIVLRNRDPIGASSVVELVHNPCTNERRTKGMGAYPPSRREPVPRQAHRDSVISARREASVRRMRDQLNRQQLARAELLSISTAQQELADENRLQRDMGRGIVQSVLVEQERVASVQAEEERNMEFAIAASNIDQYKTWGKLPDDLKNLITQKIVEPKSRSTLPFMAEFMRRGQTHTHAVCLPCS